MMYYSLYNKRLDRLLEHPKIGIWFTPDITEARDMLTTCQAYVQTLEIDGYKDCFVIIDTETKKEIT